jgi:hypothetical protein
MAIIERDVADVLRDQNCGNAKGMADTKFIIYIRILACYVGYYSPRFPNLIPDVVNNRCCAVDIVSLNGS